MDDALPVDPDRLCLLSVHAHPDDEASKGAGTVSKAAADGAHTVLVCCTGGEQGDILNPALDVPEVRDRLAEVRMEELAASTEVIGYRETVLLGYRDSGMPDTPANEDPRCFARADHDEAVGRLVAVIRRTKPQVVVTYGDDQSGYPHPDHLRVHDISVAAFDAAGDPDAHLEAGEPWQPLKLYYTMWSKARVMAMHEKFLELGLESPFGQEWLDRPGQDDRITTRVDISDFADVRPRALLAHRTQVDPESPFWFGLPPEEARLVHPVDEYALARSLVDTDLPEDDLFAGLRSRVAR
ncbi:MAG: mycothiol conjugate amidase Mca [Actinomycetota bacterium]|nr:mycothiol conjugate amidase Mca [Acidimicrobiia bacterium]MDQ3147741.1 mycothiol conjugate amidase Mca [Actinomycetota bacterium]